MEDGPMDLTPLRQRSEIEWAALRRSIMQAAAPELALRTRREGVLALLGLWSRPALAAAAAILALSSALLIGRILDQPVPFATYAGIAQSLELRDLASSWIDEGRSPTRADLIEALEGELP